MKVMVRLATGEDAGTIAEFNVAMAQETEEKALDPSTIIEGVAAGLSDPARGSYYLAEAGGEPAGCLLITLEWSDWRNGWFWWIQSVYVAPKFRRHGVYSKMYNHVRSEARAADNVVGFRLYVEVENETAQATYRAMGMEESRYRMFEALL
ncbi:MAG: GNAT family N-acetyltransferase [Pseudomonadota bacterium]